MDRAGFDGLDCGRDVGTDVGWGMSEEPKNTGRFGTGNPGKPKGAVNKNTKALKDMILGALEAAGNDIEPGGGGQAYLQAQAQANPGPFLSLIGKVLPSEVKTELSGPGGEGIELHVHFKKPAE